MKKMWFILILASGCIATWFAGKAFFDLFQYSLLNASTEAKIHKWEVNEIGSSTFGVVAHYAYRIGDQRYESRSMLKEPYFLNKISAENEIKKFSTRTWKVWYNKRDPGRSSLQKIFPFKKLFYSLLALGVFIYFCILKTNSARRDLEDDSLQN